MDRKTKYCVKKPFNNTLIERISPDVWKKVLKYYITEPLSLPIMLVNAFPIHNMSCKNKSLHNIEESCNIYHKSLEIRRFIVCQECEGNEGIYNIRCQGFLC